MSDAPANHALFYMGNGRWLDPLDDQRLGAACTGCGHELHQAGNCWSIRDSRPCDCTVDNPVSPP